MLTGATRLRESRGRVVYTNCRLCTWLSSGSDDDPLQYYLDVLAHRELVLACTQYCHILRCFCEPLGRRRARSSGLNSSSPTIVASVRFPLSRNHWHVRLLRRDATRFTCYDRKPPYSFLEATHTRRVSDPEGLDASDIAH